MKLIVFSFGERNLKAAESILVFLPILKKGSYL
jgi:hypothetical protein